MSTATTRTAKRSHPSRRSVNGKATVWSLLLLGLAALVGTGLLFGDAPTGPRIGMTTFLVVLGLTVLTVGNVEWFLRKTTRPEDYQGTCPVGQSCPACGAFNYKPRRDCRSCEGPVNRGDTDDPSEAL